MATPHSRTSRAARRWEGSTASGSTSSETAAAPRATACSPSASISRRSSPFPCPRASTKPWPPPQASPASPAGCLSPRWLRSARTTACWYSGRRGRWARCRPGRALARSGAGRRRGPRPRPARARARARRRRDGRPRRQRPHRAASRGSRRGRADTRRRRALGRAGTRSRGGSRPSGANRPRRSVGGAGDHPRVGGRPRKTALDPRPLQLRALGRRAREGVLDVVDHLAAGRIRIDVETFSLDEVGAAWEAQSSGKKAVVTL